MGTVHPRYPKANERGRPPADLRRIVNALLYLARVYFRVAFKPVATVMHEQETVSVDLKNTTLKGRGRHAPCVLPRAVPMV